MRSRRNQSGFTLIEIMVVLVIMGLMVALAVLHGPLRSATVDLTAATQRVMGDLRAARARAIAADAPVRVQLDSTGALAIDGVAQQTPPPGVAVALQPPVVVFGPDGGSSGGRVSLAGAGRQATVQVDWPGGRVRLARAP